MVDGIKGKEQSRPGLVREDFERIEEYTWIYRYRRLKKEWLLLLPAMAPDRSLERPAEPA